MKRALVFASVALTSCATLPPTRDPEGCDRLSESRKQAGSDLVVDGDLYCATDDGDCELTVQRRINGGMAREGNVGALQIHILREEAERHHQELVQRNEISFCFPPELWFPSAGHYRGRFYLHLRDDRRYQMAQYPRTTD